jgi:hypothetical protein
VTLLLCLPTPFQRRFEHGLDVPQVVHPLFHVGKTLFDECLDIFTASRLTFATVQQDGHVSEREARGLSRSDES